MQCKQYLFFDTVRCGGFMVLSFELRSTIAKMGKPLFGRVFLDFMNSIGACLYNPTQPQRLSVRSIIPKYYPEWS